MRSYITSPLYYVNARPHLGHSYTTILADIVKRHRRQRGESVVFLTGTDEHGEKIAQMAEKQGKSPKALADEISSEFKDTWQKMNLDFDIFYRTTDPSHIQAVQHALATLKEKGEIVFREYEGKYCVGCERFLTDSELNADGLCPDHLKKPEPRKEANYFFLMSKYQQKLIEHYEKNPETIRPENYRNEVLSFLKQPLGDLCISRPKERLTWGIELPFDKGYVTYVWFDALLNYLVATGWPDKTKFDRDLWASVNHFIAKDILKAHAIYWPTMLLALGVPVFKEIHTHGYWLIGGTKMSKSLGNSVRPLEIMASYGPEVLRFYLLREMSFGLDATFTLESFVSSVNSGLANGIGNLASRVMTLCQKNLPSEIPAPTPGELNDKDRELLAKREQTIKAWDEGFRDLKYQNALKAWSEWVTACDLYVNDNKPWALAKDPNQKERLRVVLSVCLETIQALMVLSFPVMPQATLAILNALGIHGYDLTVKIPPLSLALEIPKSYKLGAEVPKLFARISLPTIENPADPS